MLTVPSAADLAATVARLCAPMTAEAYEALDALVARCQQTEQERDDYRFWNERVRTCEHHTKDVIDGDCNHDD